MTRGIVQGISQGLMRTVTRLATRRFGRLPRGFASSVSAYSDKQLDALADALLDIPDAKALALWLKQHPVKKQPSQAASR